MKTKLVLSALALFLAAITAPAIAGMEVSTWDTETCEQIMSTNHFMLAAGESVTITLNQGTCDDNLGTNFFGYHTKQKNSRRLTSHDKIRLTATNNDTEAVHVSDSGSLFLAAGPEGGPNSCTITATNMGRKEIKLRLASRTRFPIEWITQ